ncbi:MmgE/PrpD family protein [Kiloniella sp. EL199]|uniref:MmgE/PrpD family protein n=1 Tax=Kiloniella sp. EL199 TaxID=2107581 RepID=UPI000EA2FA1B|nr:MmgE/PrpD family protein [Kiloniella sp. EL199]
MSSQGAILSFIHDTTFDDLSSDVVKMAERCCLDLLGVAVAGRQTELSQIITEHAVSLFGAGQEIAPIPFTGQIASPAGSALAMGMTIDAFDAHDGHRLTKGHAGAAILPALLAFVYSQSEAQSTISGKEFITTLVIGYEVSLRAGIALHSTACDYHTSGAWNAIGAAAMGARLLKLNKEQTRHALGIAEYHGPRSQMMRCIDHPTMLKDGSGWGAMTGVSAAYLARSGFTGAPAITLEHEDVISYWDDLYERWEFLAQYFKPYPVCRWAQPAIQAVSDLMEQQLINHHEIQAIEIRTFHEGICLGGYAPTTTEEAQYAIAFPVAALIVRGTLGANEVSPNSLRDPLILALSEKISLNEGEKYNAKFPGERWADVTITLNNGEVLKTPATCPNGDPENPLTDDHILRKFHSLCEGSLHQSTIEGIVKSVGDLKRDDASITDLLNFLKHPISQNGCRYKLKRPQQNDPH